MYQKRSFLKKCYRVIVMRYNFPSCRCYHRIDSDNMWCMWRGTRPFLNRISPRCLLICFGMVIFSLIITWHLLTSRQQKHVDQLVFSPVTLVPGLARLSWGSVDQIKVFVEEKEAKRLSSKIRVLCLVLTMKQNQESQALAVNQTWGSRCTKLLFVTLRPLGDLPHVVVNVTHGRNHLTAKTMSMFKYAQRHYINNFDWFLKADDDTYVVMENLRYLLSFHDPSTNMYLGHHFKRYIDQGYMSGGAGYVISQKALRTFGEKSHLCVTDGWEEDVDFGKCMENIGVPPYESKDSQGRNSFHAPYYSDDLYWMSYIQKHAPQVKGPIHIGPSCCSQLSVSFHKVDPQLMYLLEFLLYRMAVFGRHTPDNLFKDFFQSKVIPRGHYVEDAKPHFV